MYTTPVSIAWIQLWFIGEYDRVTLFFRNWNDTFLAQNNEKYDIASAHNKPWAVPQSYFFFLKTKFN